MAEAVAAVSPLTPLTAGAGSSPVTPQVEATHFPQEERAQQDISGGGRSWLDIRAFRANWDPWTDQGEDPRTATESAIYTWGSFIIIIFEKD